MRAAWRGDLVAVKRLLEAGANPKAATLQGFTAAMRAARDGHLEVLKLLQKQGADMQAVAIITPGPQLGLRWLGQPDPEPEHGDVQPHAGQNGNSRYALSVCVCVCTCM
jgi:hypothetical protein